MDQNFDNVHTHVVNILTWFLLVTSVLSVLVRWGTKHWTAHKLTMDDWMLFVALVRLS